MSASKPHVDARLREQLAAAPSASQQLIEAVVTLKVDFKADAGTVQDNFRCHAEDVAGKVIGRVQQQTGSRPGDLHVLANLGALVVSASAAFISALIKQPEVASATANEQAEDLLIRPVAKRPVAGGKRPASLKKHG